MLLRGLGKISLKIKAGNPVALSAYPFGSPSYSGLHGSYACLGAANLYLAPRLANFSLNPADIKISATGVYSDLEPTVYPTGTLFYNGNIAGGISLQNPTPGSDAYEYLYSYLTDPFTFSKYPTGAINPGLGIAPNAPTKIIGYGTTPLGLSYGIAANYDDSNFFSVSQYGANPLDVILPSTIAGLQYLAINNKTFFAQDGSSYDTSVFYGGNISGAVEQLTFDDPVLNATLPESIKAQGAFFSLELQDSSDATHYVLVNTSLTSYVELVADISGVPSTLANGVGINFFPSLDGLIYYGDDVAGISDQGGVSWTPLYANLELPFPAPFDMSSIQRTRLNIACCPTGDGHR